MTKPLSRREAIRAKILARTVEKPAPAWLAPALGPCRIWTGPTSGDGRGGDYPRMSLDGQTVAVHIVSYVNEHGYVPGKKQLDHLCRCRPCVNDLHLDLVTHKKNQKRRDQARGIAPKRKRRRRKAPPACSTIGAAT